MNIFNIICKISLFIASVSSFSSNKILSLQFTINDDNGSTENVILLVFGLKHNKDYNLYPCLIYKKNTKFLIEKINIKAFFVDKINDYLKFFILKTNNFTKKKYLNFDNDCKTMLNEYFHLGKQKFELKTELTYINKNNNEKKYSQGVNEFIYDIDSKNDKDVVFSIKDFDFIFKNKSEITETLLKNKKLNITMFSNEFYDGYFDDSDKNLIKIIY